jgi:formate dehydrogenase
MRTSDPHALSDHATVTLATVDDMRKRIRHKSKLKGRQAEDEAVAEVRQLLGAAPHRRDLLIENLHVLNDSFGALHDRHLVALAKEMNIPMASVYEVATFYHHFEVLKGDAAAPGLGRLRPAGRSGVSRARRQHADTIDLGPLGHQRHGGPRFGPRV